MRRAEDSIMVRAKKRELVELLEDYIARLKFHFRFKKSEKRVQEIEEKHGIRRFKNGTVQTRTG